MLLKIAETARLLNVTGKEVLNWIRKDGLPAALIDGEFEVNRVDLLEWATEKGIAIPSDFLAVAGADTAVLPSLRAALEAGGIHYDVPGGDKVSVLRNVVSLLPIPPGVDAGFLLEVMFAREALGTTAVGNGIAIPHVRHPILLHMATPSVTLCFLRTPIDFEAPDGKEASQNKLDKIAPGLGSDSAAMIEPNRRRSQNYVEDLAIEDRAKMAPRRDARCSSYSGSPPEPVRILFTLTTPTVRCHLHLLSRLAYALREPRFKEALEQPDNAEGILAALD